MRLLVTGACGFIGANYLYHLFATDDEVFVCNFDKLTYAGNPLSVKALEDRYGPERYVFIRGDIADPQAVASALDEQRIDAVVNFAAESHVDRSISDPAPFVTTNVLGTQNLLHAAKERGIQRFVHVSTDEVYGTLKADEPAFTEDNHLRPNSPYSASKASADLLVRAWWKTYGFPAVITRCSNNYGPYQFPEKLLPLMITRAEAGESLPVYGDGRQVRDWIHVRDHCRGVDLALRKGKPGGVYNFGGAAERANIDVVKAILAILGKPESLIKHVADRPGHDRRYAMDFSLAERELGFQPEYSFEQGLEDTIRWYRDNREWVESVTSGAYLEFMRKWYGERL